MIGRHAVAHAGSLLHQFPGIADFPENIPIRRQILAIDAAELQLTVDGEPLAAFSTVWCGALGEGDYFLVYLPAGANSREIGVTVSDDALRMEYTYAEPIGGDVWVGVADNGMLSFTTHPDVPSYLLIGFDEDGALVLDVTDPLRPQILFGFASLVVDSGSGLYLSHASDTPAPCIAVDINELHEVEKGSKP